MRRIAATLAIVWLLACMGNALPCLAAGACVAADSCCDSSDSDHGQCPPSPDCPCCPQLRPALPVVAALQAVPTELRLPPPWSLSTFRPFPHPREILHVPKLAASIG